MESSAESDAKVAPPVTENLAKAERENAERLHPWIRDLLPAHIQPPYTGDAYADLLACIRAAYPHYQIFDEAYYQKAYLTPFYGGEVTDLDPFEHYMSEGRYRGNAPSEFFSALNYFETQADIRDVGLDACMHYMFFGWKEGRPSGTMFDPTAYLNANVDIAEAGLNPFQHFMSTGRFEGRTPNGKSAMLNRLMTWGGNGFTTSAQRFGKIIFVSHDADVGGAQKVVHSLAKWVLEHTGYDVRIVAMKTGGYLHAFNDLAPTFDVSKYKAESLTEALQEFCGSDVRAVFLNSVASAGFLDHCDPKIPVLSYIHELPNVMKLYPTELERIKANATTIIAGSEAVRVALREEFGVSADQLDMVQGFVDEAAGIETLAQRRQAKEALGFDPDTLIVSACGVLHWRKSPKTFIEAAERVLARSDKPVRFVWVGGGPDHDECISLIKERGIEGQVSITGYEPSVQKYFDASDVFLLTSEEDPFPLVCLMAGLALNPIICFAEAGGMPELVKDGCGEVVPFFDLDAMADATLRYINDPDLRAKHGHKARELVMQRHTINTTGPRILDIIRRAASLNPAVSVVVPNYNYETYLPQRLSSITSQTFQDFEVILLDDKSSDGSADLLREWAEGRPATRVVVNEENSGSPFAQWIKGMALAESDLVWMAEADDFCDPYVLASLIPDFDDRSVFLGHVKSVPVDSNGEIQGDYEEVYLNRIAEGRWSESYVATDHEEASLGLGIANCIPNASAVVMRKFDPDRQFEKDVTSMRMCGDWFFYLEAMRGGRVVYRNDAFNYHRRHTTTVTSQTEGSPMYFEELQTVRDYVQKHYVQPPDTLAKIEQFTTQDLDRFGITDATQRQAILAAATQGDGAKAFPSILFVVSDLSPGGGQMFIIRMANAWAQLGGRAILVNIGYLPTNEDVASQISNRVALISEYDPILQSLPDICSRFDIDLIHSSLWWADSYVNDQIENLPDMPWMTTMHGCHESILAEPKIDEGFPEKIRQMLSRVDAWITIADKNKEVFDVYEMPPNVETIANGVPITRRQQRSRQALGLREDAIVLCLASRAIESKGWYSAAEMAQTLNAEGIAVDLMLIGAGPARDDLAENTPEHVHLYGHVADIHDYIDVCDIGILPSFFVGESMPLVLLEMMGLGKPIVATDAGEIPSILGVGEDEAGRVVPLQDGAELDVPAFTEAIRQLATAPEERERLGSAARTRFETHYTIEQMMQTYLAKYREIIAMRAKRQPDAEGDLQ